MTLSSLERRIPHGLHWQDQSINPTRPFVHLVAQNTRTPDRGSGTKFWFFGLYNLLDATRFSILRSISDVVFSEKA